MVIMNKLDTKRRALILRTLVEGNSMRSTVRITGAAKNTVSKLLQDAGRVCAQFQRSALRNLPCKRVQVDEIWSFCYAKEKSVPAEDRGKLGYGDVWTWVALCADTKLVPCWLVGERDAGWARVFLADLSSRLASRVQMASDGLMVYLEAVDHAFGEDIDYAQLRKLYGPDPHAERRYSPPVCVAPRSRPRVGRPDPQHIATSYVERQNLTIRMSMRRFTRVTNAFSKKIENLEHAVALHLMYYNFCRIHSSLRVTPAMAAGVSDHVWEIEDIVGLLEKANQTDPLPEVRTVT